MVEDGLNSAAAGLPAPNNPAFVVVVEVDPNNVAGLDSVVEVDCEGRVAVELCAPKREPVDGAAGLDSKSDVVGACAVVLD